MQGKSRFGDGAPGFSSAPGLLRGRVRSLAAAGALSALLSLYANPLQTVVANGDTRSLTFNHIHTKETLTVTYKRNGRYDEAALKQLNWYLRDWRRDEQIRMDPHLFDVLWEIHREVNARGPITIVSAYRSPKTNEMLRSRSRGVAQQSQHTMGRAIDFYIPNSDLARMREVGLRLERGGVGFYPRSGSPFMHVDTGGVRHWPRMSRDQLARVFPDGKTVHIPSDGKPMGGYALALAEIERRGGRLGAISLAARDDALQEDGDGTVGDGGALRRLIASLFGRGEEEGDEAAAGVRSARTRIPTTTVLTAADSNVRSAPTPQVTLASAPMPMPHPARLARTADVTASLPGFLASGPTRGSALGYAPDPGRFAERFGPIPGIHRQLTHVGGPAIPQGAIPQGTLLGEEPDADATRPSAFLFAVTTVEQFGEMRHPVTERLDGMVAPVQAALYLRFERDIVHAPATFRFAGAAVVALPTLAFHDRSAVFAGAVPRRY